MEPQDLSSGKETDTASMKMEGGERGFTAFTVFMSSVASFFIQSAIPHTVDITQAILVMIRKLTFKC